MKARPCLLHAAGLLALAGCAAVEDRTDYHRHSMSDLRDDWKRPGIFLFETTTSSLYPAESDEAEAKRIEWLAGWMKRLGYCPGGWEVMDRYTGALSALRVRRAERACGGAVPRATGTKRAHGGAVPRTTGRIRLAAHPRSRAEPGARSRGMKKPRPLARPGLEVRPQPKSRIRMPQSRMRSSTRRFFARPASVALSAIGDASP